MNHKEICENTWKLLEFVKALSSDPATQALLCLNANSHIQNELSTEALRQIYANIFNQ